MIKPRNAIGKKCAAATIAAATVLTLAVGTVGNWAGAEGLSVSFDGVEAAGAASTTGSADGLEVVAGDEGNKADQLVCSEGVEPVSFAVSQPSSAVKHLADELESGTLAGGNYIVDADVTVCNRIEVQADTTIQLGDATLAFELEGSFHVPAGVKLTIRRMRSDAALAQVVCRETDQLVVNEGTTILDGIKLSGGTSRAAVNRKGAELTLLNCDISGCTEVAVKSAKGATVHLADTAITSNGCGVESTGRVAIAGTVVVEDNKQGDLNIGGTPLLVEGALADEARMGLVWSGDNGTITEGFAMHNEGKSPATYFSSKGKAVIRDAAGEASLVDGLCFVNEKGKADAVDPAEVTDLAGGNTGWIPMPSGWYTFSHSVSWEGRGSVDGDVKMIIPDGVGVDWKYGIHVRPGCSLTIYGQEKGTGELHAYRADMSTEDAGIGGNAGEPGSTITICGAHVTAEGSQDAAGIGGGDKGAGGNITIYDGVVKATGYDNGAGIGGGYKGNGGTIAIHGGTVDASSDEGSVGVGGAGIGAGAFEACGTIKIDAGTVTAHGGSNSAGIGGGADTENMFTVPAGGSIEILGGKVVAESGDLSAGIGSGAYAPACSEITIEGANVTATGCNEGAGIGTGKSPKGYRKGKITVRNAHVHAESRGGAGIGSGWHKTDRFVGSEISIQGDSVVEANSLSTNGKGQGDCYAMGDAVRERDLDPGQITLDGNHKVTCYDEGYKLAPAGERGGYCAYRSHVKVEPCDHNVPGSFEKRGEHHLRHCYSCLECVEQEHDFKEDGSCRACHYVKPQPAFGEVTWGIGDRLHLDFPVSVPGEFAERFEGAYCELSIGGNNPRTIRERIVDARNDGHGNKIFSFDITPIEMGQQVSAVFHYDGDEGRVDAWGDTKGLLARDAKRTDDQRLAGRARRVANLGHYLQGYLAEANGWEVGHDYAKMDLFFEDELDVAGAMAGLAQHAAKADVKGAQVKGVGMYVTFGATASIDMVITPKDGAKLSGRASFDGREVALERQGDGTWRAHVEGVRVARFDEPLVVEGECGGHFSVEASVLSYAAHVGADKSASDAARQAMAAVWQLYSA